MHLDATTLHNTDRALATEWLLTDGAGGYASSTVLMCGTRRYHGLWVPAVKPPVDRRVILSHVDEHLTADGHDTYLSTTEYRDGFFPDGFRFAERFDLEPLPHLMSQVGGFVVEREVLLLWDGAGVCLTYRVHGDGAWALDLAPMLALRSFHHLMHRHDRFRVEPTDGLHGFRCLSDDGPGVFLWTDGDAFATVNPVWYNNVLRRAERERGFDHFEDLLAPGRWSFHGNGPREWRLFCSLEPPRPIDVATARKSHMARQVELAVYAGSPRDKRLARLARAAGAFLVKREVRGERLATVVAGYHWFSDWGRDTLISLPGLAMETGRLEVAEKVLRAFAAATSQGMIPNRFAEESGQPEYNTVDASLWFIQAMAAYVQAGGKADFVREHLWSAAREICEGYAKGTRFGIRVNADDLITAGSPDTQLTWMDAKSRGRPVTPRYGQAVEICALWISGLRLMKELASRLHLECPAPADTADKARQAFERLFWNPAAGCLYDCILPDGRADDAVRPNQIFAVSLPHAPLTGDKATAVVRTVRDKLLTPRGLRTLAPDSPAYRGRYVGGPDERDAAYHQGTVWPWLLGPYVDAIFAVEKKECARAEAGQILAGLLDSTDEAGLGFIAEVFDGNAPHRPGGCIAQAWSVAAAIHIWKRLEASGGLA